MFAKKPSNAKVKGPTSKGRGGHERGGEEREGEGRERKGRERKRGRGKWEGKGKDHTGTCFSALRALVTAVVVNALVSINEVALRWAWLLGEYLRTSRYVTDYLGQQSTQPSIRPG